MKDHVFKFPAKEIAEPDKDFGPNKKVKTFKITTETRDGSELEEIDLSDKTVYYQFVYNNNNQNARGDQNDYSDKEITWFSDADTIRELFPESNKSNRDGDNVYR